MRFALVMSKFKKKQNNLEKALKSRPLREIYTEHPPIFYEENYGVVKIHKTNKQSNPKLQPKKELTKLKKIAILKAPSPCRRGAIPNKSAQESKHHLSHSCYGRGILPLTLKTRNSSLQEL